LVICLQKNEILLVPSSTRANDGGFIYFVETQDFASLPTRENTATKDFVHAITGREIRQ
jgi:hypothetical protein